MVGEKSEMNRRDFIRMLLVIVGFSSNLGWKRRISKSELDCEKIRFTITPSIKVDDIQKLSVLEEL